MKWYVFLLAAFFLMGCTSVERQKEVDDRRQAEELEKRGQATPLGECIVIAGQFLGGLAAR